VERLLFDEPSHEFLSLLSPKRIPPTVELLVLNTPSELRALQVFDTLARTLVPEDCFEVDVAIFSPEGERWAVADLEDPLRLLSLTPLHRRVVLVTSFHLIDPATADMLLKSFEEPPAGTTLVLSLPDVSMLPITLQSRVSGVESIPFTPNKELVESFKKSSLPCGELLKDSRFADVFDFLQDSKNLIEVMGDVYNKKPTPSHAAQVLLTSFEETISSLKLPTPVSRRLRSRFVLFQARLVEEIVSISPDLVGKISSKFSESIKDLKTALSTSIQPAPHLTKFLQEFRHLSNGQ
jgi:hypothetical protein